MAKRVNHLPNEDPNKDEDRDLGFGSVVSRDSQQRLLNPDGSFNVERRGLSFWASLSLYHSLLTMPWGKFLTMVVIGYIGTNAFFAVLYVMCGPDALAIPNDVGITSSFVRAFFFSVQTFSTIGYGHIYPVGIAPNIIVAAESLVGLLGFALPQRYYSASLQSSLHIRESPRLNSESRIQEKIRS